MQTGSIDAAEVARFNALAAQWWDPEGPMRPLHQMNPARIGWIDARLRRRFEDLCEELERREGAKVV